MTEENANNARTDVLFGIARPVQEHVTNYYAALKRSGFGCCAPFHLRLHLCPQWANGKRCRSCSPHGSFPPHVPEGLLRARYHVQDLLVISSEVFIYYSFHISLCKKHSSIGWRRSFKPIFCQGANTRCHLQHQRKERKHTRHRCLSTETSVRVGTTGMCEATARLDISLPAL